MLFQVRDNSEAEEASAAPEKFFGAPEDVEGVLIERVRDFEFFGGQGDGEINDGVIGEPALGAARRGFCVEGDAEGEFILLAERFEKGGDGGI